MKPIQLTISEKHFEEIKRLSNKDEHFEIYKEITDYWIKKLLSLPYSAHKLRSMPTGFYDCKSKRLRLICGGSEEENECADFKICGLRVDVPALMWATETFRNYKGRVIVL